MKKQTLSQIALFLLFVIQSCNNYDSPAPQKKELAINELTKLSNENLASSKSYMDEATSIVLKYRLTQTELSDSRIQSLIVKICNQGKITGSVADSGGGGGCSGQISRVSAVTSPGGGGYCFIWYADGSRYSYVFDSNNKLVWSGCSGGAAA